MANVLTSVPANGQQQLVYGQTGSPAPSAAAIVPLTGLVGPDGVTPISSTNRLPVDASVDNLPAAAAIADGAPNPTTAAVDARLSGYNGATWDRLKASGGQLQARMFDAAGLSLNVGADGDGQSSSTQLVTIGRSQSFNGSTWDRRYNNAQGTLLASAARTASTSSALQTNFNARGVLLALAVTAVGTGNLYLQINGQEIGAGQQYELCDSSTDLVTTATTRVFLVYPGIAKPANLAGSVASATLPRNWYGFVVKSDASSWTFSLSYAYII